MHSARGLVNGRALWLTRNVPHNPWPISMLEGKYVVAPAATRRLMYNALGPASSHNLVLATVMSVNVYPTQDGSVSNTICLRIERAFSPWSRAHFISELVVDASIISATRSWLEAFHPITVQACSSVDQAASVTSYCHSLVVSLLTSQSCSQLGYRLINQILTELLQLVVASLVTFQSCFPVDYRFIATNPSSQLVCAVWNALDPVPHLASFISSHFEPVFVLVDYNRSDSDTVSQVCWFILNNC